MDALSDQKILDSWEKNISPWVQAVQKQQIESRRLVTDQAIINAVINTAASGARILDIGCGEGWLVRALTAKGFSVTGIDAIQGLIDQACIVGDGDYQVLDYEHIALAAQNEKFDLAICNFSLLGKASVEHVFKAASQLLNTGGQFIVQTLHPHTSCANNTYVDGWRKGSWEGFSDAFTAPAPWYFRTIASWFTLFKDNGLSLSKFEEPINPNTGQATSLLMIGTLTTQ